MAAVRGISHCYQRPTYEDWPYTIFTMIQNDWGRFKVAHTMPPHYGLYEVALFRRDGAEIPACETDSARWRRVVVTEWGNLSAFASDNRLQRFGLKQDETQQTFTITPKGSTTPSEPAVLKFTAPEAGKLTLDGPLDGHVVHIELARQDEKAFVLTSRGFHWISEAPFYR